MKRLMLMVLFLLFLFMGVPQLLGEGAGQIVFYVLVFAMGVGLIFYMRWFQKFAKQVNAMMPLLTEDPRRYIMEMEQLLQGRRPANIRAMLQMNIAAAYMEMGDYDGAKQKLLGINGASLKGANAHVYFLNLAYVYIHTGENNKALDLTRRYKKQFLALPMGGNLPHLNAFIHVFESIQNGQWDTAKEGMLTAKEEWPEKVVGVDFDFLLKQLNEHFGEDILANKEAPAEESLPTEDSVMDEAIEAEDKKAEE